MAILPILRYPDERLKARSAPVTRFDSRLSALSDDLAETMRAAPGIGITAAHAGIFERLVVLELDGPASTRVYVNPKIVWSSGETAAHAEGSVSMPGVVDTVVRPARLRVEYQTLEGESRSEAAEGLLSVCLQHEIDQLDGIFWIERLSRLKRERIVRKYRKLQR